MVAVCLCLKITEDLGKASRLLFVTSVGVLTVFCPFHNAMLLGVMSQSVNLDSLVQIYKPCNQQQPLHWSRRTCVKEMSRCLSHRREFRRSSDSLSSSHPPPPRGPTRLLYTKPTCSLLSLPGQVSQGTRSCSSPLSPLQLLPPALSPSQPCSTSTCPPTMTFKLILPRGQVPARAASVTICSLSRSNETWGRSATTCKEQSFALFIVPFGRFPCALDTPASPASLSSIS